MSLTLLSSQMPKDLITNYHAPSTTAMTSSQSSSSIGEENVPEMNDDDNAENVQTNNTVPLKYQRRLLMIIKKERRDKLYIIHLHFGFFVFIIVNVTHSTAIFFQFHLFILVPIMVFS